MILLSPIVAGLIISLFSTSSNANAQGPKQLRIDWTVKGSAWSPIQLPSGPAYELTLGADITIQPGWHIYWKNPGPVGLPPKLIWKTPGPVTAEVQYLSPSLIPSKLGRSIGFEGQTQLLFRVLSRQIPEGLIQARVKFLVCRDLCIPEEHPLEISSDPNGQVADMPEVPEFFRSFELHRVEPKVVEWGLDPTRSSQNLRANLSENLRTELSKRQVTNVVSGLPNVDVSRGRPHGDSWTFDWISTAVTSLKWEQEGSVLVQFHEGRAQEWISKKFEESRWDQVQKELETISSLGPQSLSSIAWTLLFAFLGGALLNLMPCVFPVLSLKAFALAKLSAHPDSRYQIRKEVLFYALGTIGSFISLGGVILLLRASSPSLGWGFQLQSPLFVSALVLLFSYLALTMMGSLEFDFPLIARWSSRFRGGGAWASFGTGVLSVFVAAPCTAPFMGTAVARAFVAPAFEVLLLFAAMGLGLSFPFFLLVLIPRISQLLPRPGVWMERFRFALSFPLWATVIYLLYVLVSQRGVQGLLSCLITLLALVAIWTRDYWLPRGKIISRLLVFLLIISAAFSARTLVEGDATHSLNERGSVDSLASLRRLHELQAEKKAYFVDFTAAWCVTCQVNRISVLDRSWFRELLEKEKIEFVVIDWTNESAEVAQELKKFGAVGVPLAVMSFGDDSPPKILSQILTETEIRQVIESRSRR